MYDRIVRVKRTRMYIPEIAIGLAILLALNIILFADRPGFEGISPNPYWIVVIAIAARYGRVGGSLAGIATALVFAGHLYAIKGIDLFYDDPWILRFPFFFILIGFLIGEVKTVFILREDYLSSRVEELQNFNDKLKKEMDILKEAHKGLSVDVATTTDTITILNEITSKLKSTKPTDIYRGILESLHDYMDAEECSFYALEGNLLTLQESLGWKDYYRRPTTHELGNGLVGLAAQKLRPFSVKDMVLKKAAEGAKEMGMLGDTLLAIPVIGLENRVYGVASIEKMPLLKLTDATIRTTNIICELAASSLNNAYSFLAMERQQIKEKEFDLFKYHFFLTRLDEEFNRSWNYMLPLSLIAFRWEGLMKLEDEKRKATLESMITLIHSDLRTFDVLAKGPTDDVPLVLLLATTSGPQANTLKQKFAEKIEDYGLARELTETPLVDSIITADFNPNKVTTARELLKLIGL
jgi:hypothetical protein